MTSIEILDKKNQLIKRNADIISAAKTEVRELTAEENAEFDANQEEIRSLDVQTRDLETELKITNKNINTNISIDNKMKTNDLIIRSLSEAYNSGKKDNIIINRAHMVTGLAGEGEDVVPVDLINEVIMPLREKNLFGQLPVRIKTNLTGDYQVPVFGGSNLSKDAHVGETGMAAEYTANFTSVTLSPHRFSVWTTLSKQWLIQAVPAATDSIVEDLSNQFWDKITALLLSDAAATDNKPAGLLKDLTKKTVADYKELCDFEADLREKNYTDVEFILSPRAEAYFKSTIMGETGPAGMVMQNGKVDGIDTVVTSRIDPYEFLLLDASQIQFGFWENPTISFFEDFQLAQSGQIGIILSGFYDVKLLRDDAIAYGEVDN